MTAPSLKTRLIAAALALLALGLIALAARCSSVLAISCSPATLLGDAPELDVPYATTRAPVIAKMLELAEVAPDDQVIDLGTGDGRILIAAARDRGASGLGVDLDPVLVGRARRNAEDAGVADRVEFRVADIFDTPLAGASVVTMYLLPEVNLRLRPMILDQMRPGSRVVSHAFDMGEWSPTATARVGGATVHMWVVPAKVAGRWRFEASGVGEGELLLTQRFDRLGGELRLGGRQYPLLETSLSGTRIRFTVGMPGGPRRFEGIVDGGAIHGGGWRASKAP